MGNAVGNLELFDSSDEKKSYTESASTSNGCTLNVGTYTCNSNHDYYLMTFMKSVSLNATIDEEVYSYNLQSDLKYKSIGISANSSYILVNDTNIQATSVILKSYASLTLSLVATVNSIYFQCCFGELKKNASVEAGIVAQFIAF